MRSSGRPSGPAEIPTAPAGGGAALIAQYVLALLVLVAIGIATVWQHTRAVRAGYRLGTLESERTALREQERKLELLRVRESRLEALEGRAKKLGLLLPGDDPDVLDLLR